MNIRKNCQLKLIALFLLMLSVTVSAFAEAPSEDVLSRFLTDVQKYNRETRFLTTWSQDDQEKMLQIMGEYGMERREYEWTVPENAISDAFAHFYGDGRGWTYVQRHEWDKARVALGLSPEVYYVLPDEDMLSEQEALALIERKVADAVSRGELPGAETYLNHPEVTITIAHMLLDGEKVWWFQFYQEEDVLPGLTAYVHADGRVYTEYEDQRSISNVYLAWEKEREMKRFAYWSLEDQAAFYQELLALKDRELTLYGYLPAIAEGVLSREHTVPPEGAYPEADAIAAAKAVAQQYIDLSNTIPVIYHCRTEDMGNIYQVGFIAEGDWFYSVLIDSATGGLLGFREGQ